MTTAILRATLDEVQSPSGAELPAPTGGCS